MQIHLKRKKKVIYFLEAEPGSCLIRTLSLDPFFNIRIQRYIGKENINTLILNSFMKKLYFIFLS